MQALGSHSQHKHHTSPHAQWQVCKFGSWLCGNRSGGFHSGYAPEKPTTCPHKTCARMFPAAENQRPPKGRVKGASHKGPHTNVQDRDKWLPEAWLGMKGAAPGQGGESLLEPEW